MQLKITQRCNAKLKKILKERFSKYFIITIKSVLKHFTTKHIQHKWNSLILMKSYGRKIPYHYFACASNIPAPFFILFYNPRGKTIKTEPRRKKNHKKEIPVKMKHDKIADYILRVSWATHKILHCASTQLHSFVGRNYFCKTATRNFGSIYVTLPLSDIHYNWRRKIRGNKSSRRWF